MVDWRRMLGASALADQPLAIEGPKTDDERRFDVTFQDWLQLVASGNFGGNLVNTSMQTINEEELSRTCLQAYRNNGPVFALVLARLQIFSQIRFQWTRFDKGQPSTLFGTDALQILERPWPGGVTSDLLGRMEVDLSMAGNSFTKKTTSTRLNRLRPDWVTIVMGSNEDGDHPADASDVEVIGYLYRPGGYKDRMRIFTPDEVSHYAPLPDPINNFLGLSWVTPVLTEVGADDASTIHKRRFFQNAATPNLAIKFDASLDIEDVRKFKALMEEEHKGLWNAYKTLYLGGGADPVVIGKDFAQLDFAVTQGKGESRLASAAGVPPSWVGFSEGLQGSSLNQGNFTAARRRLSDGTMMHLWTNAAASLESIVKPRPPGRNVGLWFDTKSVPFLREDSKDAATIQETEARTIAALIREGFTPESVVIAVQSEDWTQLVHTGLTSVQLQPPGSSTVADGNDTQDSPPAIGTGTE